jgi:DNA polymerase III alpha subunit
MIQLKVRTEYTFGKTFAPIKRVVERLKEIGCTAAAIVDDNTWGHVAFYNACKEAGIQPMLGVEITVSDDDLDNKTMFFIAKNTEGLSELYRYTSKAYRQQLQDKFGGIARLYRDDVREMSDNIFKFSGTVLDKDFLEEVGAIVDIGPESRVLAASKRNLGLPFVTVGDNSYVNESDSEAFDFLSNDRKMTPQYILENVGEEPIAYEIAEACKDLVFPKAPMIRAEGDLEKMCRDGIKIRELDWNEEYEERLKYELELINSKDFTSYFIVVADMVQFAKQHMLVGPSRGSAAGSLVCYLSRITEIDPIEHNLSFERFIDVSRADLPDIDLDFPDSKRELVFEYMAEKYGDNKTAHIGTITRFKPKSALIQVCKKLNIPSAATFNLKSVIIERSIADARASNCLEDTLTTTDIGKKFIQDYPQAISCMLLEGHASHTGVHAAGLLVCNDRIDNYATVDNNGIAHVEKGAAEQLGLLKIDVLGLRTLGIIEDSGVNIDWYKLPLNDEKTYEIFNNDKTCGIFQFEGNALRSITKQINFKSIIEIDAVTALARPGPFAGGVTQQYIERMKGKAYAPLHPLVQEYMKETYGLPIYQEQTMVVVKEIGKFDWQQTSFIRKAVSKRLGKEFFDSFYEIFKKGALENGMAEEQALETWNLINTMGSWQMNKAHTRSYAVISYWCAYLKAHFPLEFAAANLRNAKDEDSAIDLLREMVEEGIEYVPFDLELSEENWCVKDGKLIGGFNNLKGIGDNKAKELVQARNEGKLTEKQHKTVLEAENAFSNIFPFSTTYSEYYENPGKFGIVGEITKIKEFDGSQEGSHVFLGELIYKNLRDANEEVNVKKRNGKIETGPVIYFDIRVKDDTGFIGARISRFDYERMGRHMFENIKEGAHVLIRARFVKGIKFGFITKYKVLKDV